MKEPIDYNKFTSSEKMQFIISSYMGIDITEKQGRYYHIEGHLPVTIYGTPEETYAKTVRHHVLGKYNGEKFLKSWDSLIPVIKKLRQEAVYKDAFKNQMKQVDHYLNYFDIETTVKYVVGAINVLNGKRGEYPI